MGAGTHAMPQGKDTTAGEAGNCQMRVKQRSAKCDAVTWRKRCRLAVPFLRPEARAHVKRLMQTHTHTYTHAAGRPGHPGMSHSHGIGSSSKLGRASRAPSGPVPLDVLHAQQVITAMDLCPYKDPHTGLPLPFTKAQGLRNQGPQLLAQQQQQQQRQQQQVRRSSVSNDHRGPGTEWKSPREHGHVLPSYQTGAAAVLAAAEAQQPQSTAWWPSGSKPAPQQQQQQQQQRRQKVLIQQQVDPPEQQQVPHSGTEVHAFAPSSLSSPPLTDEQLAPTTSTTTFFLTQDPNQAPEQQQQQAPTTPPSQLLAKIGPRPSSPRRRDHPDMHKLAAGTARASARGPKGATTVPRLPTLGSQGEGRAQSSCPGCLPWVPYSRFPTQVLKQLQGGQRAQSPCPSCSQHWIAALYIADPGEVATDYTSRVAMEGWDKACMTGGSL
eukprot:1157640-Pelagomonas_calceolata.AAC.12